MVAPIGPPTETIQLPPARRVEPVLPAGNLSQTAYPVYEALQAATTLPPSADPTFVPPPDGNALRLYAAVAAIAAERVYPAPVFSFTA